MKPDSRLTRRQAVGQLGAGALLAAGLWPGTVRAADNGRGGPLRFIVVNDTHAMTPACGEFLAGLVRQMKTHAPDFCLLVGDLTDTGERDYLAMVRDAFKGLGAPLYVVPGNHDYLSPTDRSAYDRLFPQSLNYYFERNGWQFIGLDSTEGQKYEQTTIQPATLQWVDEQVKLLDKRRPTVLFTHFPLGADIKMRPLNADALLDRFRDHNLRAIFNGHYHAFTERKWRDVVITTNRCCALGRNNHDDSLEEGYFLCEAREGRIASRSFVEYKPASRTKPPAK